MITSDGTSPSDWKHAFRRNTASFPDAVMEAPDALVRHAACVDNGGGAAAIAEAPVDAAMTCTRAQSALTLAEAAVPAPHP